MTTPRERALAFVSDETEFQLGALPTEQPHPATRGFAETARADAEAGVRLLQRVDQDIPPVAERVFAGAEFAELVDALAGAITGGQRIFFVGCGATGRLAILLEAAWRRWCAGAQPEWSERVRSVMSGGDYALIRSVEGYEDFPQFGKHQLREAGLAAGDVVVAVTEGGETSFVIGGAWAGLEAGARVFFAYNNPTDVLREHVTRSREVMDESRITKLDLATGPMGIAGSTRMQAVTSELLVTGAALEIALGRAMGDAPGADAYVERFRRLLADLEAEAAVATIADVVRLEADLYGRRGLITYAADRNLLDILTDTTERAPTFSLPPYRKQGDEEAPESWAFVKNPLHATEAAWVELLQHEPRGLGWDSATFARLGVAKYRDDPPKLDNAEIHRFRIGNEPAPTRSGAADAMLMAVSTGDGSAFWEGFARLADAWPRAAALTVGAEAPASGPAERHHVACTLPDSPLDLWRHLGVKLVLNTLSTTTMAPLGRLTSNWMASVEVSNKKLIDRATRLVADLAGVDYTTACIAVHEAAADRGDMGQQAISPVTLAVDRLKK